MGNISLSDKVGVGMRSPHFPTILKQIRSQSLACPWFEVISENFMGEGGHPIRVLEKTRQTVPIACHGVSLNLGSADPLNRDYLRKLAKLVAWIDPWVVSDHLCWTGVQKKNLHDLLPLPLTAETLAYLASRIDEVQEVLRRPIAVENLSYYLELPESEMPEWDFLNELSRRTGCRILLDVNNIFVSSQHQGFDPQEYVRQIDPKRVIQFHLAGYSECCAADRLLPIDTHDEPVKDEVWRLFEYAIGRIGKRATLIEWDDRIPSFSRLMDEAMKAEQILREAEAHAENQSKTHSSTPTLGVPEKAGSADHWRRSPAAHAYPGRA